MTTCDTISIISLCLEFSFKKKAKVALFFWSKPSRNQLRLPYFLQSLQVSDKPQDDDGASPLSIWHGSNHVTFDFLSWETLYTAKQTKNSRKNIISDLSWATTNCSKWGIIPGKKKVFPVIVFWLPKSIWCWAQISIMF